jgi:hypothetical protein
VAAPLSFIFFLLTMKAAYEKPETAASSLRNQHHNQHHHQQYHQSTNNYNISNNTRSEGDPANSSSSEYSADPSLPRNKRAAGLKVFARGCGVAGVLLLLLPLVVFLCMLLPDEFTEMNHWVRNGAMKKKKKKKRRISLVSLVLFDKLLLSVFDANNNGVFDDLCRLPPSTGYNNLSPI